MATHSSTLAWEIPWTEEPGRLYSPCGRKESDITRRAHTCMHTLHTMDINPSWDIHVWKHSHSKACLLPLFKVYFCVCVCVSVCVCACMHVQLLSHVWLFATLWTIARQVPLSMGFSGQECWSGLPFLTPVDLPDPGMEPMSPISPLHWQVDSLPLTYLGSHTFLHMHLNFFNMKVSLF